MVLSIYVCLWTVARTQDRTGCGLLLLEPYSRREHAFVFLMIVDDALCTLPCCVPYQFLWWVVVGLLLPTAHTPRSCCHGCGVWVSFWCISTGQLHTSVVCASTSGLSTQSSTGHLKENSS